MWVASGKDFNRSIAMMPRAGPGAKNAKAHLHPKAASRKGINQIVATVMVKPAASCSVKAVPTTQEVDGESLKSGSEAAAGSAMASPTLT